MMIPRIWRGTRATLPIALSIAPFGLAYGAVASQGMAPWQARGMSVLVFAGTAQFVGANMIADGASILPVLMTTLLLNLRLVLMSAALTTRLDAAPRRAAPLLAHLLTDESFAVSVAAHDERAIDPLFFVGSGLAIFVVWQVATSTGLLLGGNMPQGLGFEYALPGSLICLLFLLVRDRKTLWVALAAMGLALLLRPLVTSTWSTLLATLLASGGGAAIARGVACRRQT